MQPTIPVDGILNLRPVKPGIYRGGQPTTDAAWNWLKANGVTRIVKLNSEGDGSDIAGEALGMEMFYHPISTAQQLVYRPKYEEVQAAVKAIQPGTFVHCTHGEDRTGLVVACYRVWDDAWPKETAEQEMEDCGFHWELLGLELFWEWAV